MLISLFNSPGIGVPGLQKSENETSRPVCWAARVCRSDGGVGLLDVHRPPNGYLPLDEDAKEQANNGQGQSASAVHVCDYRRRPGLGLCAK